MIRDRHPLSVLAAGYTPLDLVVASTEPTVVIARRAGGTAGNVSAITALLGCRSALVAEVGSDAAGDELVPDLQSCGVELRFVRRRDNLVTARILHEVLPGPRTHRFRFSCPACGQGFPKSARPQQSLIDEVLSSDVTPKVFFVDRAWKQLIDLGRKLRARGSLVFFEPQRLQDDPEIMAAAATADVVKVNHSPAEGTLDRLHALGVKVVLATQGAGGAVLYSRRETGGWHDRTFESAVVPSPVDTAGAGDWCSAVLISALVTANPIDVSSVLHAEIPHALAVASRSVAFTGARGLADDAISRKELGISARKGDVACPSPPSQACAICLLTTHPPAKP